MTSGSGGMNAVPVEDNKPPAALSMLKQLSIKRQKSQIVSSYQQIASSKSNKEEGESFLDALEAVLPKEKKKKKKSLGMLVGGGRRVGRTTKPPHSYDNETNTITTVPVVSNTVPGGVTIESVVQTLQNKEELEKDPERWIELQTSLQHATTLLLRQAKNLSSRSSSFSGRSNTTSLLRINTANDDADADDADDVEETTMLISTLAIAAVPLVPSLRSTLVKAALQLFQVIFHHYGHCINKTRTLGIITPMLLRRSGGTGGGAGACKQRDNFLCMEADLTLTAMIEGVLGTKVLEALLGCVVSSCSSQVAAYKLAMHIDAWIKMHGGARLVGIGNNGNSNHNGKTAVMIKRHQYKITTFNIRNNTLIVKLRSAGEGFCREKSADVRKLGRQIMGQLDALSLL